MAMSVLAPVLVLIVSIVFFAVMGQLFFHDVIITLLNGLLLYVLLYRAYFDLQVKDRWKAYLIALCIGLVLTLILPPLPPLWPITFVVIVVFVCIELTRVYVMKRVAPKQPKKPKAERRWKKLLQRKKKQEDEEEVEEPV